MRTTIYQVVDVTTNKTIAIYGNSKAAVMHIKNVAEKHISINASTVDMPKLQVVESAVYNYLAEFLINEGYAE
jgi:hypothetical protein